MKSYILTLIGALVLGNSVVQAQDYDDVYYDTKSSKQKTTTTVKTQKKAVDGSNPYFSKNASKTTILADTTARMVNGRDVDEYNRRYADDAQQYYADESASYEIADSTQNNDFKYTDRIVKFHNADVVIHSDDPDLIELYYDNRPQVNLIVGTTYTGWYSDPFSWGYYDPWYSYSLGWGRPYYRGWYAGWYSPWNSWGWGWHSAWHYGWYDPCYSWGWGYPHYGWGSGLYGYRYSDSGRNTFGTRSSRGGVLSRGGNYSSGRPGYATTVRRGGGTNGTMSTQGSNGVASSRLNSVHRSRNGYATSRPENVGDIRQSIGANSTDRMNERRSGSRNSFMSRERVSSNSNRSYNNDRNTYNNNRQSSSYDNSSRRGGFGSGFSSGGSSFGGSRGGASRGGGGGRRR